MKALRAGVPFLAGAFAAATLVALAVIVSLIILGVSLAQFLPVYGG